MPASPRKDPRGPARPPAARTSAAAATPTATPSADASPAVTAATFSPSVPASAAASAGAPGRLPIRETLVRAHPCPPQVDRHVRADAEPMPVDDVGPEQDDEQEADQPGEPREPTAAGVRGHALPAGGERSPRADRRASSTSVIAARSRTAAMLSGSAGVIVMLHPPSADENSSGPFGPWTANDRTWSALVTARLTNEVPNRRSTRPPFAHARFIDAGGGAHTAALEGRERPSA